MITKILKMINDTICGVPLCSIILIVGIIMTWRLKGLQIRKLPKALKYMVKSETEGEGEVSSFGALCTALSATIGTGNIVGVATAIATGGPGALLWMWIAALFGMATKYSEGVLAIKYRITNKETGHVLGGPFYYIEQGMGKKYSWLGKIFAFFGAGAGLLGIGTITQVNGISSAIKGFFDPNNSWSFHLMNTEYSWTVLITAFIVTICVAIVTIGGIKRISKVSEIVVPFMAVIYISFCVILIICNISKVPEALMIIIKSAFGWKAAGGGVLGSIFIAMQNGIARGIFSNEAGLGSAPIAAASAKTKEPVRQGLVSMTGTFIDTIVLCSMTGLAIVITGAYKMGLEGADVTTYAFQNGLPFPAKVCSFLLMMCLIFFAFTTILGWDFYSEKCLDYLTKGNQKIILTYRYIYIAAVFVGPFLTVSAVWTIADIFNALMALPNLIAILYLQNVVSSETKDYFKRLKEGKVKE